MKTHFCFLRVCFHTYQNHFSLLKGCLVLCVCARVCVCIWAHMDVCFIKECPWVRLALSNFQIAIMPSLAHCGDKMQNVMNYFIITIKSKPLGRVSEDVACDLCWLVAVFFSARFGWLSSQSLRRLISNTNDYDTNEMSHLQGFLSLPPLLSDSLSLLYV